MRWIAPFLRGLLLVLAAILLGLGVALFAIERTSWLGRRVRSDIAKWTAVAKTANIKAD